jgi:hypothetical protein
MCIRDSDRLGARELGELFDRSVSMGAPAS